MTARLCDAKASLSSTRSSSSDADTRALEQLPHRGNRADAHDARIDAGDAPSRRTRRAARCRAHAPSPRSRCTSAAAPSLMPLAFPAVTVPSARNAGFSPASASRVRLRARMLVDRDVADRDELVGEPPRSVRRRPSAAASGARTRPDPRATRPIARRRSRPSRPSTRAGTSPRAAGSGSASRASCPRRSGSRAGTPRPASP